MPDIAGEGKPNLVLVAEGESKQTVSVCIENETLRTIHELLIEQKKLASAALLQPPTMTWLVQRLLNYGIPEFKRRLRETQDKQDKPATR